MAIETEVKFYIPDLVTVQARLTKLGAEQVKPRLFERNLRYDDAVNSLTPAKVVLRLRQDDHVRLTYKSPLAEQEKGVSSRNEIETEVADFEAMDAILKRLGYHVSWAYEKYRTTFELYGAEIVLDEMPFGNFIEIEGEAQEIEHVIAALGLGKSKRILASYATLFDQVKGTLGLRINDLTFANFAELTVPAEMFR